MSALTKPIPALYTVYILRSTVRHASLYIGSTPNPPRRLKQHNGEVKGGAARTSRPSLRPWEMVAIVSGFPGMMAALKFEWALTNPHLSLHIPSSERLVVCTQRKKNGQPKRPRASMGSVLSNLHLLLRVPSFARWPLGLHFFSRDVHDKWRDWACAVEEPLRRTLTVKTDFGDSSSSNNAVVGSDACSVQGASEAAASLSEGGGDGGCPAATPSQGGEEGLLAATGTSLPWGIYALHLDYGPLKEYIEKARSIFSFEREGSCVHCNKEMPSGQGLYAVCPNLDCEAVGHLQCWSRQILDAEGAADDVVVPLQGRCPSCRGDLRWGDMMKELSLRVRDPQEVEKILRKRRKTKKT